MLLEDFRGAARYEDFKVVETSPAMAVDILPDLQEVDIDNIRFIRVDSIGKNQTKNL